jgi:small conductance mechanosensitive channel
MLGRPTFAGVEAVSGEAVYVRIVVKARASQQVPLTRELRERLKGKFDEHGVVVPVLARPMGFNADGTPMTPGSVPPVGGGAPR